jgi:hypothetical protein
VLATALYTHNSNPPSPFLAFRPPTSLLVGLLPQILANTCIPESRRFLFRPTLVGFAVGAISDIVRETADGEVCVRALSLLNDHLVTYVSLNSISPEDLLTAGRQSDAVQMLQGNPALRQKLNQVTPPCRLNKSQAYKRTTVP